MVGTWLSCYAWMHRWFDVLTAEFFCHPFLRHQSIPGLQLTLVLPWHIRNISNMKHLRVLWFLMQCKSYYCFAIGLWIARCIGYQWLSTVNTSRNDRAYNAVFCVYYLCINVSQCLQQWVPAAAANHLAAHLLSLHPPTPYVHLHCQANMPCTLHQMSVASLSSVAVTELSLSVTVNCQQHVM